MFIILFSAPVKQNVLASVFTQTACMKKLIIICNTLILLIVVHACKKENNTNNADNEIINQFLNLPATPYNYANINWPQHFRVNTLPGAAQNAALANLNTPANNEITDNGATLGRVIFYDKNLSLNRTIACASCHKPELAFSDSALFSKGFNGGTTRRHSMTIINAALYARGRFFWDERAATLEQQVLMPFQDATEMGLTLTQLVDRVKEKSFYPILFRRAFGSEEITGNKIALALAQFVRSVVSFNSKYDVGRAAAPNAQAPFSNFTASENSGKNIFLMPPNAGGGACIACHSTEAFINNQNGPTSNGLDALSTTDLGVFEAIPQPQLRGTFKTTTLRNIALTAPYMHDGRFKTLEEVVEHYNSGIQAHPNLGGPLRDGAGNPIRLNLTAQQKTDLVNFLKTLTDNTIATDVRYSNPFK